MCPSLRCPQTDITFPLNSPSASDLYKPESDINLPSIDKLEAFRRLILRAKAGNIEVTHAISEVPAQSTCYLPSH